MPIPSILKRQSEPRFRKGLLASTMIVVMCSNPTIAQTKKDTDGFLKSPDFSSTGLTGNSGFNLEEVGPFPEREIFVPADEATNTAARLESDELYASRLVYIWERWVHPFVSFELRVLDLKERHFEWGERNRQELKEVTQRLFDLARGSASNEGEQSFPTESELRQTHAQISAFVSDHQKLRLAYRDLTQARKRYCEENLSNNGLFSCSGDEREAIENVPASDDVLAILSKRYFDPIEGEPSALQAKIAKIILDDSPLNQARNAAIDELNKAKEEYDRSKRFLADAETAFQKAAKAYWVEIEDSRRKLNALQDRVDREKEKLEAARSHVGSFERTTAYQDGQTRIEKNNKRIAAIGRVLPRLIEALGDNDFSKERRRVLLAEQESLQVDNQYVRGELNDLRSRHRVRIDDSNLRKAEQDLERKGREPRQRIRYAGERLDRYITPRDRLRRELETTEARYELAVEKLQELDQRREQRRQQQLHWIFQDGTFKAKKLDNTLRLEKLNALIKQTRETMEAAEKAREDAHKEAIEARNRIERSTTRLNAAMYASTLGQTAIDAGFQIPKALKAVATTGPRAVLPILKQWGDNLYFSPKKIHDPLLNIDGKGSIFLEIAKGHLPEKKDKSESIAKATAVSAAKQAVKQAGKLAQSVEQDLARKQILEKAISKTVSGTWGIDTPSSPALLEKMQQHQKAELNKLKNGIDEKLLRKGKLAFGKALTKQLLKGFRDGVIEEIGKRFVAQLVHGPAWDEFVTRKTDFAFAQAHSRYVTDIYWKNHDILAGLVTLRDQIAELQFDRENGFTIMENSTFDVERGLEYKLNFNPSDGNGSTNNEPYPGVIALFLNDVELKRKPDSNVFVLENSAARRLRSQRDETLDLKVQFK